ncbi:hypothetical protein AAL_01574 [Moelleriella libera RCEF 2490]|uniref:Uncharacterized protein n=1 Tax=Moelleriella libera RCEF 2490 TaxID=1081109 RepID=A0A166U9T2_9HYPO|nr:hypothetical protein AAL_01574 [Moelleriella libera RCEF 2490]
MPGRTVKSLQNMWTKINKSIAEFEQDTEDRPPIKRPTPRKRGPNKPKANTSHDDEDDRGSVSPVATPKKRRACESTPIKNRMPLGGYTDDSLLGGPQTAKAPSVDEKKIKMSSDEDDKGGIRCVEGEI